MNNNLKLSDWLTEKLNVEEKVSQIKTNNYNDTDMQFDGVENDLRVGYDLYSQAYGFGTYSFGVYSFSAYSFSAYGFGVYSFAAYGFSAYGFGVYSFAAYGFSAYGFRAYSFSVYNFGAYSLSYYFAYCATCQVCNTCQGKCETAQKVSDYVGTLTLDDARQEGPITDEDWNKMVDWIKTGAPYNNKTAPSISNVTGDGTQAISKDRINEVNTSMATTFENASSGIAQKSAGDSALASDLVTLASTLNASKISNTITCCQKSGGQGCLTCQDRCQTCQSMKNSCTALCQAKQS